MEKNDHPIERIKTDRIVTFALIICTIGIVLIGVLSRIYDYIQSLS